EPHPTTAGLVAQVGDLRSALLLVQLLDLQDQPALAIPSHLVGQLGDDDRFLDLPDRLDMRLALNADPASAGGVGLPDSVTSKDQARAREVGALDVPHQPQI